MNSTYVYKIDDSLYINLTNRCSNNCTFCVRLSDDGVGGYDLWLKKEPEPSEVIPLIGNPAEYKEIVFCGFGEPMERIDALLEIAAWVKEHGGTVRINTNGQANMIHGRDVTPELKGKVDIVSISLNAPNAKEYDALCRSEFGEQAFAGLLDFARRCTQYVPRTILSVVDVLPAEDIEQCRRIAAEVGAELRVRQMIE